MSCLVYFVLENGAESEYCFPKPTVTSNVLFCPQAKDIQFAIPRHWTKTENIHM